MAYLCKFNKKGWLLEEEGRAPPYLNSIISSLDTTVLSGSKVVRDELVEYEVRGPLIHLRIGGSKGVKDSRNKDSKDVNKDKDVNRNKDSRSKDVHKNKDVSEEQLDYSTTTHTKSLHTKSNSYFPPLHKTKKIFSLFSNKISIEELKDRMEIHLVRKNVDYETTKILTDCVINGLREEKKDFVTPEEFKKYMADVLGKIIPSVDHNKLIQRIQKKEGVFSIAFVGVNGVGKSTSLSKVCYWLLQQNLKVYIAACDTFRAGAVEQLKVHVGRFRESGFEIGFYEKGYGKDDLSVARTALQNATKEGYDVLLIDTAGRMHNKRTLMDSLSKFIKIKPDYIVYVGEALVGTDSLMHIKEFNNAIQRGCEEKKIDSILLTKVDTVDDKIGQILNMTFSSRSPILFLGTGQGNSDILKVDSEEIVNILLGD